MSFKYEKGPLLITASLLILYPICLAELATTSAFANELSSPQRNQTTVHSQLQSLPRTSQGLLLPASQDLPSISNLESTLQDYRTQLQRLLPNVEDKTRIAPLLALINQLEANLQEATKLQAQYAQDLQTLATAQTQLDQAITNKATASAALQEAQTAADTAQSQYDQQLQDLQTLAKELTAKQTEYTAAQTASVKAKQDYDISLITFNEATSNLAAAREAYSNPASYIPDPSFQPATYQQEHTREVATTTLVPHTTYTTTGGILAEVFNRRGYNNAPPLPTQAEIPVYTTTVPDINFQWGGGEVLGSGYSEDVLIKFTGNLLFPEDGNYQFYAPGDDGVKLNIAGMDLINDWRDKGGGGSISQEVFIRGGVLYPFTLYYYENGGGANVWLYTYQPAIGFTLITPSHFGTSVEETTTYEEVTTYTTETYYTTEVIPDQVAPLIPNPDLLPAIDQAQTQLSSATSNLTQADTTNQEATSKLQAAGQELKDTQELHDEAVTKLSTESLNLDAANNSKTNSQVALLLATSNETTQTNNLTSAEQQVQETRNSYTATFKEASSTSSKVDSTFTNTQPDPKPEPTPEPEPTTFPEEGSKEIPTDLSAENLMSVDLTQVDPTELTPAQADQLVEAALQTFETAEVGSPEYAQALDALYLAAEQDDIVLDPALAVIPGLQAATELINFLGNAGADMSPKVRAESKKVVVASVVAAGAAIQSAASAASSAASGGGASGGSSKTKTPNRKVK